ncbi:MAG TPA: PilZ domain-containing protein [Allosphingosinicella sp.]|jgi:hypothetical protein
MSEGFDPDGFGQNDPGYRSRRTPRVAVDESASLTPPDRYKVEIKVRDVSASGFMAECAQPVLIGSNILLEIPGVGPVHAQVRWQLGNKMGGMFLDPISLARCEWTAVRSPEAV